MTSCISFNRGQLEIALCTFNRPTSLSKQLEYSYSECVKRNILLRVVDASPNDESEEIVNAFNVGKEIKVDYTRVDSDTIPGYMQMQAILSSKVDYVWVYSDSRKVDFAEFDEKIFPNIFLGYDIITFFNLDYMKDKMEFDNCSDFLNECFVPFTCTGCSIYKRELFDCFNSDVEIKEKCDSLFMNNYAFSWIGYTLYALSSKPITKELYCNVRISQVDEKRKRTWVKRFYKCWIDDIKSIIDNLPSEYTNADRVLPDTWRRLKLDSDSYCYIGRTQGDLNKQSFLDYSNNGLWKAAEVNMKRIKFYACSHIIVVRIYYLFVRLKRKTHFLFK